MREELGYLRALLLILPGSSILQPETRWILKANDDSHCWNLPWWKSEVNLSESPYLSRASAAAESMGNLLHSRTLMEDETIGGHHTS